jgi:arylsulfatase A-like enzyme
VVRSPRLVVLYATCSLNKDFLAPYSPSVRYTPHIARFAAQGRVFLRHQVEAGVSGPDYAALLTGTQVDRHGVFVHPAPLANTGAIIAEVFTRGGYGTFWWDGHPIATAELGYARGVIPGRVRPVMLEAQDPGFLRLLDVLRRQPNQRAFVATSFTVTHSAYGLDRVASFCKRYPDACSGHSTAEVLRWGELYHANRLALERNYEETARRLRLTPRDREQLAAAIAVIYASRVAYLDELFGAVVAAIDAAGLADDSLIVFTADHGEMLYRASAPLKWTHGFMLTPDDLSPPLIMRGAGLAPGVYEGVSRSIDVFPTVASLCGLRLPAGTVDGVDLSPTLRGASAPPELTAFSHTMLVPHAVYERSASFTLFRSLFRELDAHGMWVAARGDLFYRLRSRLGRDLPPELYDLKTDPGLTQDLFDARNQRDADMVADLRAYKQRLVDAYSRGVSGRASLSDAEQQERLRSLGYIEGQAEN